MDVNNFVIVHLINPKEQFWGLLLEIKDYGVTIRGINVNSFEDWARQVHSTEKNMDVLTVFFPLHRVEKIFLDENLGVIPSLAHQFKKISGIAADEYFKINFKDIDNID